MRKKEIIIIACIILLSVLSLSVRTIIKSNHQYSTIVISVDNKVVKKIPLNNSNDSKIYEFEFNKNKGYVETKNGNVRMLEMDRKICPQGICSLTGWITKNSLPIICLPNRIIATIG